jgi:hypothetical protein
MIHFSHWFVSAHNFCSSAMIPRPSYMGAGTRNSPIAIDDSEDEVFLELYHNSNKSSPQNLIPPLPEDRSRNMHINPPNATLDIVHRPPESSA